MHAQYKIICTIIFAGLLFWAYDSVGKKAVAEYKVEQAVIQAKIDAEQQIKYNKLAAEFEAVKANRETVFKTLTNTIERVVERPVYTNVCIDSEGVEAANKALEGKL